MKPLPCIVSIQSKYYHNFFKPFSLASALNILQEDDFLRIGIYNAGSMKISY